MSSTKRAILIAKDCQMSSTKRAVLIAKDCRHFSLQQQSFGSLNRHDNQYISINLNKFGPAKVLQFDSSISSSLSNNNNQSNINGIAAFQNPQGFVKVNDYETTKKDVLCQKRYSTNNLYPQNPQKEKKEWKNKTDFGDKNLSKSTLSLHIEAYENNNAIKAQNNNTGTKIFVDCDGLKASKKDQWVIPRQQPKEEEELMEAEVMAFKFSNRLMNFSRPRVFDQHQTIYLTHVKWITGKQQVEKYFSRFGKIQDISMFFDAETGLHRGFASVKFEKPEAATAAVQSRPHVIDGDVVGIEFYMPMKPLKSKFKTM